MTIFIIGSIVKPLPPDLRTIEVLLRTHFKAQSTYQSTLQNESKIKYVLENIKKSTTVVALYPHISFGTSIEIGFALSLNKKVIIITSSELKNTLETHPFASKLEVLDSSLSEKKILQFIQNESQSHPLFEEAFWHKK